MSITIQSADANGASGTTTRTKKFAVKVYTGSTLDESVQATPSAGKWSVKWPTVLAAGSYRAVAGTGSFNFTVAAPPPPPDKLFPTSPFWNPVGANPTIDPNSDKFIANFLGQGTWGPKPQGTEFSTNDWTRSYYEAKDTDPTYTVKGGLGGSWTEPNCQGNVIHIPQGARPAGGTHWQQLDGGFTVKQQNGYLYSAWRSEDPANGQAYQWAKIDGKGNGVYNAQTGEMGIGQAKLGTRQGQITYKDLVTNGEIPHALVFEVRQWHGRRYPGWPGDSKDSTRGGYTSDTSAMPMGAHVYLNYTPAEIDALSIPGWKKVIVRAMAEFGLYSYDNGGSAHALDWESGIQFLTTTGHNPWLDWSASVGLPRSGTNSETGGPVYSADIQSGIDWSRLRVLTT
jgi:hypothetical protein